MFRRHQHEYFWTGTATARCYVCGDDVAIPQSLIDRVDEVRVASRMNSLERGRQNFRKAKQRALARKRQAKTAS
jgi:hypothetical protein